MFASASGAAFGDIISPFGTAAEDTAAIQAAIDAAGTGGTVELGDGTFEIDEQLMVTNGVTLVGQGWEQTILKQTKSGSSKRCVAVDNGAKVQGMTLTGGKLTGNWNSGAGASVKNGTISWCCISNNVATGNNIFGGGVYIENNGTCTIDHSVVVGNELTGMSGTGGGIGACANGKPASVVIDSCLICRNKALNGQNNGGNGGGIGFASSDPSVTIRNCTIAGNQAVQGGGLKISGSKITLVNTIVSGNSVSAEDGKANVDGTPATGSEGNFTDGDPLFKDAENGDYHLANGSPAIAKGVSYDGINDDLDGTAFATVPSIGCYERMTADPTFAPAAKRYYPSTEVTLACATDGAAIYYTIDGSDPTESGEVYAEPIMLTETTTIRAYAVRDGLIASKVVSETYTNKGPPMPSRLGSFRQMATFTVTRDVAGAAKGMPVLLKLSEDNPAGFRYADCDPAQMRFGDAEFNPIPFEIDTWNPEGESLIWVKAPLAKDAEINFVYNGTATVESDPASVWADYTGVWHLNDVADEPDASLARSQGVYPNSTAVADLDGHLSIDSIPDEAGRFGKSFRVNDWTSLKAQKGPGGVWVKDAGANSPLDADGTFTISGWFKHQDWNYYWDHVFYKRAASSGSGAFAIENNNSGSGNAFAIRGGNNTSATVTLASMRNSWSYLTFVYEGTKCAVYQDGALVASVNISKATDNNDPLVFGNNINIATQEAGDACWQGWIDEVRFAKGAKDAAFVAAEYAAMTADDLLAAGEVQDVGPEVMVASPILTPASGTAFYPSTNVTMSCLTEGATIRYTLDGTDPTESSEPYEEAIVLSETTTIKARAFKDGLEPSVVAIATYECTEPIPPVLGGVTVKPRMTQATFSGTIESVGNLYATACDVYLAIGTGEDDLGAAEKIAAGVTDAFKCRITGLEGDATYYYALSISNNAVFATGAVARGSFATPAEDIIEPDETPALTRAAIQEAIDDAVAQASGGTVTLSEGLFEIDEQLIIGGGITVVGQGWTNTVIKQVAKGADNRVFRCVTVREGSTLVGVTLTGGKIGAQWADGAGVYVEDGTVSWCCVSNNATAKPAGNNNYGGGIGIRKGTIDHTIIAYNTSAAAGGASYGGGIGVNGPTGPIVIDTCLIYGNRAPNGNGGGIYANMGGQKLTVRNTTMANNEANETGGAYVSAGKGNFEFVNSILADNTSGKGDVNLSLSADDIVSQAFGNVFANGTAALGEGSASYPSSGAAWFFDAANGDYHLRASAPASDSGVWYDGIVNDLDGIVRKTEQMSSGCHECTEVDPGVIKLSPIDVTTATTSATASGSIVSLGEGVSATVTLRVGPNIDELAVADTATGIVTDFALTASGLTHATPYVYEITVENDVGRTATASGEFFTLYDSSALLLPSDDPAANVATLGVVFKAAEQARQTVTLGEGVFEINAPLTADGGITVVGQGRDKTTLKQVGAGRVITLAGGSTLTGVTLTGGAISAQWQHGAGVYVEDGTVSWCCISNNATARPAGNNNYGGGIGISKGAVDHSIVAYNTAAAKSGSSYGGGIAVRDPTGPVVIDTCLIYGNEAPNGAGGGIYVSNGQGLVTVRNTTITGNSASGQGGGLVFSGTQLLQNSIVWDNKAAEAGDVSGTLADGSTGNLVGENPLFRDAANGNYRLPYASPANGIGHWYEGITVDLDGRNRGRRPEAGCYEIFQGFMLMVR